MDGDAVGARCVTVRRIGGAERPSASELVQLEPPRAWAVRGTDGPIRAAVDVTVEPLGADRVQGGDRGRLHRSRHRQAAGPARGAPRGPQGDAGQPGATQGASRGPPRLTGRPPQYGGAVTEPVPHMTPEQFRQHGHEVVDWIADYWTRVGSLPVRSQVSPGEVRAALPQAPPETGQPFSEVLADLDRVVVPGLTHWQHPGFFGYFPANTSGPSVLGDLVSAGLGVQGMSWVTSPACTELEQHVMDWFAGLLGPARELPVHLDRRRRRPGLQLGGQPGRPARRAAPQQQGRAPSGTASSPTRRPSTSRPRRTRRWRRPCGSPAWAATPSASSRWTTTWPCAPPRSPPASSATGPAASRPCSSAPRSGRRPPPRSTRSPSSARSAATTTSGCTWTPPTPA